MNVALTRLDAVSIMFGHGTACLDRRAHRQAGRIVALGKARKYRADYFALRRGCERHFDIAWRDAGSFGELYCGVDHYEAAALAREAWRGSLWDMNFRVY